MLAKFVRPSHATVVAYLALFIALGGVSYAAVVLPSNSVGTKQLKPGAVKASDLGKNAVKTGNVRDGSLLSADFKAGQLPAGAQGAAGVPGATGSQGPQGLKGDNGTNGAPGTAGAPGVSGLEIVQATSANDASSGKFIRAICPAGKRVIGTGYDIQGGKTGADGNTVTDVVVDQVVVESTTNVFVNAFEEEPSAISWAVTAQAICANVTP